MCETTVCSKFLTDEYSNVTMMVMRITLWSPKAQIILPFHHNDNYECRHTTTIHQYRPLLLATSVSFHSVTVRNSVLNTNGNLLMSKFLFNNTP